MSQTTRKPEGPIHESRLGLHLSLYKGRRLAGPMAAIAPGDAFEMAERQEIAAMAKKKSQRITLPDGLRQALTNSGKTSYQLMAETGVNHGVILRFMKGERDIRLETAEKLAAAVGLTVNVPAAEETESTD
jgi:plasmid maintenance system antidote protein VapI